MGSLWAIYKATLCALYNPIVVHEYQRMRRKIVSMADPHSHQILGQKKPES
jgi:hypothetical protein